MKKGAQAVSPKVYAVTVKPGCPAAMRLKLAGEALNEVRVS